VRVYCSRRRHRHITKCNRESSTAAGRAIFHPRWALTSAQPTTASELVADRGQNWSEALTRKGASSSGVSEGRWETRIRGAEKIWWRFTRTCRTEWRRDEKPRQYRAGLGGCMPWCGIDRRADAQTHKCWKAVIFAPRQGIHPARSPPPSLKRIEPDRRGHGLDMVTMRSRCAGTGDDLELFPARRIEPQPGGDPPQTRWPKLLAVTDEADGCQQAPSPGQVWRRRRFRICVPALSRDH